MKKKIVQYENSTNVRVKSFRSSLLRLVLGFMWKMFPGFVTREVERHVFKTRRRSLAVDEKGLLSLASGGSVDFHKTQIKYWTWGGGPMIAFVHGWDARGIQFLSFIPAFLAAGYSVMVFDGPAHGASDGKYTNYFEFSDALKKIFSHIGVSRIKGVVAHSFGAAAVINWMAKEGIALPTVLLAPTLRLKEMVLRTFDRQGIPTTISQDIFRNLERLHGHDFKRENPLALLADIPSEILIIHDREDRIVPYLESQKAADACPGVILVETEGFGHNRILKKLPVIGKALDYFGNRLDRSDPEWYPPADRLFSIGRTPQKWSCISGSDGRECASEGQGRQQ